MVLRFRQQRICTGSYRYISIMQKGGMRVLIIEDSKIYITKGDDATLNVEIALVQDSDEML